MTAVAYANHDLARRVRSAVEILSTTEESVAFGSLAVSGDGRLQFDEKSPPLSFTLINQGIHLRCLWRTKPSAALLVEADLGKLPYSIEAPTGRLTLKRLIDSTARGKRWRFALTDGQDMRLIAALVPPKPHTLISVLAVLVSLILEIRPYIDLMGQLLSQNAQGRRLNSAEP